MKCKYSIIVWMLLAVLLLVACDNGEQQLLQLAELERQNRADSLMLNDSLARDLADWFDRHGTRNEQLRAHYILGRTYADRAGSNIASRTLLSSDGNRLTGVTESVADYDFTGSFEYKRLNGSQYIYNGNGSLVADRSRGIAYIAYDLNNNPSRIYFTNGNEIRYTYSSTGEKLCAKYYNAVPNVTREFGVEPEGYPQSQIMAAYQYDYLLGGNLVMYNGMIDKVLFDGGYFKGTPISSGYGFTLYYYNKDHLGNNREVVNASGSVQQVTNYYPFGAPYADPNAVMNASLQPYKYNGKELDLMHGLNTYDYGARQYDPILARWDRVDPLAEKDYETSPYAYCGNNPVKYIDPDGRKKHNWIKGVGRDNNASVQKRYENRFGKSFVQIWAHGYKESESGKATGIEVEIDYYAPRIRGGGYYHSRKRDSKIVRDASELSKLLKKYDRDWSIGNTAQSILILHSCASSEFAQEISRSREVQDVIIIAPTENVHTSSNGEERISTTVNEETGEEIEGQWEVFKNGKPLLDEVGNPITYPSNSQVGTRGFDYGF